MTKQQFFVFGALVFGLLLAIFFFFGCAKSATILNSTTTTTTTTTSTATSTTTTSTTSTTQAPFIISGLIERNELPVGEHTLSVEIHAAVDEDPVVSAVIVMLEGESDVAYELSLPASLEGVYWLFSISQVGTAEYLGSPNWSGERNEWGDVLAHPPMDISGDMAGQNFPMFFFQFN